MCYMSKSQGDLSMLSSSQQNFTNFGIIDIEITIFLILLNQRKDLGCCYNCPFLPQGV